MARLKDTILGNNAFGKSDVNNKGILDVSQLSGGQNGYNVQLDGYVSNAAYIRRNVIAILVEAPAGFNDLPESSKWIATLKSLVELYPNSIEGLSSTLTVSSAEEAVGGAGEMQQTPSNVERARSTPSFTWTEKYGKPINKFLKGWITNLIMDPNTKVPNIMTRGANGPTDILPDYYSMTVLFVEPDPTSTRVVEAWLTTNMYPVTDGETIGARDLTAGGDLTTYSVEFTGLTQVGAGVTALAQEYLDRMNRSGMNPYDKKAFVEAIQPNIESSISGLADTLERDAAEAVV